MGKHLFLGDEAIAQAAIDAGLSGVYAYPGTPSTEVTEYIQNSPVARERKIHCNWSANEKTAMEAALGMSYAGKRSLCCMKHVGLNVAADCFMNAAMSGINGGMIILTADDPSMHSSQNEQDNRMYGNFAMIPMLEPSSQQEAYDMVYHGFELSEKLGYPILLRVTTRMAHSRAGVETQPMKEQLPMHCPEDGRQRFILLPALARQRYKKLIAAQEVFMRLYERWEEFKTTDNAKAFLYVSARNLCMDQLKRQKAAENYLDYSRQQDEAEESFLGEVIREETYRILYAAIDKLPWQTRQIVLMCMDGDSNNEVAEKLGISVNTVKTLKKNGYATLRQLLANEYVIFLFFLLEQL